MRQGSVAAFLGIFAGWLPALGARVAAAGWVDSARLKLADGEPGQWLGVGRDAGETHYSPLTRTEAIHSYLIDDARAIRDASRSRMATPPARMR